MVAVHAVSLPYGSVRCVGLMFDGYCVEGRGRGLDEEGYYYAKGMEGVLDLFAHIITDYYCT